MSPLARYLARWALSAALRHTFGARHSKADALASLLIK